MNWLLAQHDLAAWASGLPMKAAMAAAIVAGGGVLTLVLQLLAAVVVRTRRFGWLRFALPNLVQLAGLLLTFFAALSVFGVASPILGAVVTFGLALGAGADVYGGLRLLAGAAPFRIGDAIEIHGEGIQGLVQSIDLFTTTLRTAGGASVSFQNRKLSDFIIVNRNRAAPAPIEFEVVVGRSAEPLAAKEAIGALLAPIGRVRAVPVRIDKESVTFRIALGEVQQDREDAVLLALQVLADDLAARGFDVRSVSAL